MRLSILCPAVMYASKILFGSTKSHSKVYINFTALKTSLEILVGQLAKLAEQSPSNGRKVKVHFLAIETYLCMLKVFYPSAAQHPEG